MKVEHEKYITVLLEVKSQVDEMHGVVYRNGLVSSIKEQREEIRDINDKLNSFFVTRDETCPYRAEVDIRTKKRRDTFDKRLVIYGLIIGGMSMLPDFIRLVTGQL